MYNTHVNKTQRKTRTKVGNKIVLTPQEFFLDFHKEALDARHRVVAQTMQLDVDNVSQTILRIFNTTLDTIKKVLYVD